MDRSKKWRWLGIAVAAVVFLTLYVDDWGRDFVAYEAVTRPDAEEPTLRPLVSQRSRYELELATRQAVRRIRNWSFAGSVQDGDSTLLYFVRSPRLVRVRDDIHVRIEDRGSRRVVVAESRGRLHVGDLGRNTRNLRRLMSELRWVLEEGAARSPILPPPGETES